MICVERLTIRYGSTMALQDVDLCVEAGSIAAVVGPSGCGKSSLLNAIARITDLIPGARVSGRVTVNGGDVHGPGVSAADVSWVVGLVFQKPIPFPMSIRKNMQLALRERGIRNRDALEESTRRTLQEVGLWDEVGDRLERSALELSGGQQQRLCIARALVLEPSVLLLDEPCSALDPLSAGVVEDLIARLRGRLTMVLVTHNLAQARRLADQVSIFWSCNGAGTLVETGHVTQIFEAPANRLTAAYVSGLRG